MKEIPDKKQAIFEATLSLISQYGFHGTAMSKVAKEAQVSAGIIYHYFDSKDELIEELYHTLKTGMAHAIMQQFDPNQSIERQIQQFLQAAIRYTVWHPRESAFMDQYDRSPYPQRDPDSDVSQYYLSMISLFEQAKREKLIKDLPMSVIALFTIGIATSMGQKYAKGEIDLTEHLISQVVDTSWDAIRYSTETDSEPLSQGVRDGTAHFTH